MENLVEWVKKIAIFYILALLAVNIIPNEKYRKYIRFFLGILMIIMIAKPVGDVMGIEDKFETLLNFRYSTTMSAELRAKLELADSSRYESILEEYNNLIKEDISEYVTGIDAYFIDAKTEFEMDKESDAYGTIQKMEVFLEYKGARNDRAGMEVISLDMKNYLSGVYNLDKGNIYVNIE